MPTPASASQGMRDRPARVRHVGPGGAQHGQSERVGGRAQPSAARRRSESAAPAHAAHGSPSYTLLTRLLPASVPKCRVPEREPGLELVADAFGHEPAVVDDHDPLTETVDLLEVPRRPAAPTDAERVAWPTAERCWSLRYYGRNRCACVLEAPGPLAGGPGQASGVWRRE